MHASSVTHTGHSLRKPDAFGWCTPNLMARSQETGHRGHWKFPNLSWWYATFFGGVLIPAEIQASLKRIQEQASSINHLIAIGGDHTISLPLLRALHAKKGPVALIHFDAHVDTWSDNFGQVYAHG
jgi:hypothetical protein